MVILQFNKLIRNKWVWGVFALIVSGAFCFDFLFNSGDRPENADDPLKNLSVDYSQSAERDARDIVRAFYSGDGIDSAQREKLIPRVYAALRTIDDAGLSGGVSDEELAGFIRGTYFPMLKNDKTAYRQFVKQRFDMDVARFEDVARKYILVNKTGSMMSALSILVPPMELEQAVHDLTDSFDVTTVVFKRSEQDEKVDVTDASLAAWYSNNTAKVSKPECVKVRYALFEASNTNLVADAEIPESDIEARYNADLETLYTKKSGTNETDTVTTPLTEVHDKIAKTLRDEARAAAFAKLAAAVRKAADAANEEMPEKPEEAAAFTVDVDALVAGVAKEAGFDAGAVKIETSGWLPAGDASGLVDGLLADPSSVFRGTPNIESTLANFDPSRGGFPCACLQSSDKKRMWVVSRVGFAAAAKATCEEAKPFIEKPMREEFALAAFTNRIEAIRKGGAEQLLASKEQDGEPVNLPAFTGMDAGDAQSAVKFSPASAVLAAARELNQGEISDIVLSADGKSACVAICNKRTTSPDPDGLETPRVRMMALGRVMSGHGYTGYNMLDVFRWLDGNYRTLGGEDDESAGESAE
ncbi:MAG: SurA N-terminal domain-containing protein [Kiritimatiellae bacterium]|nr:SurA N-terminal domain-containing protein [Kiritimatiellia bacterium]